MDIEQKIADVGLELPPATVPPAHSSSAVRMGNVVYVGGHVPRIADGSMLHTPAKSALK